MDAGEPSSANILSEDVLEATPNPVYVGNQRIQFAPTVKPVPRRFVSVGDDHITPQPQNVDVVHHVVSEKEQDHREREKKEEKKNVDIGEHLLPLHDVAEKYKTRINLEKPGESLGLAGQQAEALLQEHGLNVLTPPKKRHPFLKYLDYLSGLFNLLLIMAGLMEYILLAINFKGNFQNVSVWD
jgi:sodium/potassium-transporting ATPase subunit alpha